MKYIFLIFFISFVSSSDMKKVYVYEDGIERHYLIYVSDAYNKDTKTNIVFGIHGYGGTASGFESELSGGFNKLADKHNLPGIPEIDLEKIINRNALKILEINH